MLVEAELQCILARASPSLKGSLVLDTEQGIHVDHELRPAIVQPHSIDKVDESEPLRET